MGLSHEDGEALRQATSLFEHPSLAAKITSIIGIPIKKRCVLLPAKGSEVITYATSTALEQALTVALLTMDDTGIRASSNLLHKLAMVTSGASGGLCGLPALVQASMYGMHLERRQSQSIAVCSLLPLIACHRSCLIESLANQHCPSG
jgi:hypothetical protein